MTDQYCLSIHSKRVVGLPYSLLALGHLGGLSLLGFLTGHDDCLAQTLQTVKLKILTWMFQVSLYRRGRKKKGRKKQQKDIKGGQSGAVRDCSADFLRGAHVIMVP